MKREYESTFVVKSASSEEDVDRITNKIAEFIKSKDGEIIKIEKLGLKKLAYNIARFTHGHFVTLDVKVSPSLVAKVEKLYRTNESIIRFMTVSKNG